MENSLTLFWLLFRLFVPPFSSEIPAPVAPVATPTVQLLKPPCDCTVTQGNFTAPLPTLSGNGSAVSFYNYGNPTGASANTGLEMSETMLIMLYEDLTTGSTSLVIILDQANDGTGGAATLAFDCLPGSAFVEFSDDAGELAGTPPNIVGNFNWGPCCTDGGVIGGVGCGNTFTINPNISSGITAFSLVYGTQASPTFLNMPEINCPITINCGGTACCQGAFEFSGTATNASCESGGDGSIDLSMDCATTPTFIWSHGATTEDVAGLDPGTYSVTITDANDCSQTATFTVAAENPSPEPTIVGDLEYCDGESVLLGVDGSYDAYSWSNGGTGATTSVNSPGVVSVTVTDGSGCTGTASATVVEHPLPEPEIMGPSAICIDYDTITLDAGAGFETYVWSNGGFEQTTNVTQFGSYFVTVTNSFGCSAFDFVIIDPLFNPFPIITGPTVICEGTPVLLDAGAGFASYAWSTGATTQAIVTSVGGDFSVSVTNVDECLGIASVEVAESPADTTGFFLTSCNPQDTGIFLQELSNQFGCDSLVVTTISFSESDSIFLFDQSCNPQDTGVSVQSFVNQFGCDSLVFTTVSLSESDSVFLFGQTCNPQDTGIFSQTFVNQNGCDSVVVEAVTLLPSQIVALVAFSCSPQDTGVVVQVLDNQFGCDSVVTTTTFLLDSDTTFVSLQSCDPAAAGVSQTLLVNADGCDSLVITTTTFILVDTTYIMVTTCDANQAGESQVSLTGTDGCDSLVITNATFIPPDTTHLFAITCDASLAGQNVTTLTNQAGCDSLVITSTTFIPPDTTLLFSTSCDPGATGVFEQILANHLGCDSLVISTVTLLPGDTTAIFQTSCDPTQTGTVEVILTNQFGCDSLLVVTTEYALADSTQVGKTTCDPSVAGVFVEILVSTDGCDSVVTTTTVLLPSDTVQVFAQSCDPAMVGTVENLLANQFGCDSLVRVTTTLLPSDTTFLQAITCHASQAGTSQLVLDNQHGCDSLIVTSTTFIPADTTLFFAESCDPAQVGTAVVVLQNASGCDSLIMTTTTLLPSDTTVLQAFSCDAGQVGTVQILLSNVFGCDSLVVTNTAQLPVDATWLFFETCVAADTGIVLQILANQFGCDSLVFEQTNLSPAAACQLDATMLGDTIGCPETTGSLWLNLLNGSPPIAYVWTDQNGNAGAGTIDQIGAPVQIAGLPPGTYFFEITDPNGLTGTLTGIVFQPADLQIDLQTTSDFNGFGLSCRGATDGSAAVTVLGGGLAPYFFNWSNGSQTGQANSLGEGWISVTVTDATGCLASDSVFLESPDSLQFSLSLTDPNCFSDGLGTIAVGQVTGGVSPFRFRLNGGDWQAAPAFEKLPSGSYLAEVEDANGCLAADLVFVNAYVQPEVSLGEDLMLEFGDSAKIKAVVNLPFSLLDSIFWNGQDCPDCLQITVAPIATSAYSVTVLDPFGCSASDEVRVTVRKDFHVFIPNAFSPNFDGFNDHFTIYGGHHVVKIKELRIFDRWGEPVFQAFNFPPNSLTYGWDGRHRGKEMDVAVFVYFTVVEFLDGSLQLFEGDVMLMR